MTTDGKFGTYISWRTGGIKFKVQLFFEMFFFFRPAGPSAIISVASNWSVKYLFFLFFTVV